jgi:hypothetical protein
MKVINNRKADNMVKFEDLAVGEGYLDDNEFICIKTSQHEEVENCICYSGGSWGADYQNHEDWVTPIEITYTIEG